MLEQQCRHALLSASPEAEAGVPCQRGGAATPQALAGRMAGGSGAWMCLCLVTQALPSQVLFHDCSTAWAGSAEVLSF